MRPWTKGLRPPFPWFWTVLTWNKYLGILFLKNICKKATKFVSKKCPNYFFSDWWRNNGAWSFALEPYYSEDLTYYFDDPIFDKMAAIIDPYSYRDRLTMPKMVISSTGDEFFAPDRVWKNYGFGGYFLFHINGFNL